MTIKHIHFKTLFLAWCFIFISLNVYQLYKKLSPEHTVQFAGLKFSGLDKYLKNETHIGYATDLDLKETIALAEYEQAQYVLAPVILDVTGKPNNYFILNCSTEVAALNKLKELNATPLLRNQFGVILALRNKSQ
ncbi:MAG: hypothetical protein JNN05_04720 [Candidatus Omnitrophica bacterium]|nr:hypothetical protein [Candidatus Omnitrophota bacterium]